MGKNNFKRLATFRSESKGEIEVTEHLPTGDLSITNDKRRILSSLPDDAELIEGPLTLEKE